MARVLTNEERDEMEMLAKQLFYADRNHMWACLDQREQNRYRLMADAIIRTKNGEKLACD